MGGRWARVRKGVGLEEFGVLAGKGRHASLMGSISLLVCLLRAGEEWVGVWKWS